MEIAIRLADPRDARVLAEFRLALYRERVPYDDSAADEFITRSAAFLQRHLALGDYRARLACAPDCRSVGTAAAFVREMVPKPGTPQAHEVRIQSVYVDAAYRAEGIGTQLMRAALEWVRVKGIEVLRRA